MKELLDKCSHDIVIGVISSVIGAAVLFALQELIKNVPSAGSSFVSAVVDQAYQNASTVTYYTMDIMHLILLCCCMVCFWIFSYRSNRSERLKIKRLGKRIENIGIPQVEKAERDSGVLDEPRGKDEVQSIEKEMSEVKKEYRTIKRKNHLQGLLYICLIIITMYSWSIGYIIPLSLKANFERNLEYISPYAEEKTILQLKSEWQKMKTKKDYDSIFSVIDDVKEKSENQ